MKKYSISFENFLFRDRTMLQGMTRSEPRAKRVRANIAVCSSIGISDIIDF